MGALEEEAKGVDLSNVCKKLLVSNMKLKLMLVCACVLCGREQSELAFTESQIRKGIEF